MHSSSKFTPFEIVNAHNGCKLPFDLNEDQITQQFIQDRADQVKEIRQKVFNQLEQTKKKICERRNQNFKPIENIKENIEVVIGIGKRIRMFLLGCF